MPWLQRGSVHDGLHGFDQGHIGEALVVEGLQAADVIAVVVLVGDVDQHQRVIFTFSFLKKPIITPAKARKYITRLK